MQVSKRANLSTSVSHPNTLQQLGPSPAEARSPKLICVSHVQHRHLGHHLVLSRGWGGGACAESCRVAMTPPGTLVRFAGILSGGLFHCATMSLLMSTSESFFKPRIIAENTGKRITWGEIHEVFFFPVYKLYNIANDIFIQSKCHIMSC